MKERSSGPGPIDHDSDEYHAYIDRTFAELVGIDPCDVVFDQSPLEMGPPSDPGGVCPVAFLSERFVTPLCDGGRTHVIAEWPLTILECDKCRRRYTAAGDRVWDQ